MSANGLHWIQWRRVAVARVHRTAARQFARDLVHIQQSRVEEEVGNIGKQPPSDLMETGCRGKNPSDCRESVREILSKYTARIHRTVASQFALETGDKS